MEQKSRSNSEHQTSKYAYHSHTPYTVRNTIAIYIYSKLCEMNWNYNSEKMFFFFFFSIMNNIQVVCVSCFLSCLLSTSCKKMNGFEQEKDEQETNREKMKPSSLESMDPLRANRPIEFTSSSFTLIFQINCPNWTKSWVLAVGILYY